METKNIIPINNKNKSIVLTINFINFFIWMLVLISLLFTLLFRNLNLDIQDNTDKKLLTMCFIFLKIVQTLQISDIILAYFKLSGTSTFSSLMQISSRLLTVYVFLNQNLPFCLIFLTLFPWSVGDATRSLYYIFKDNYLVGFLRYNLFLVLYPIGVTGEVFVMEEYLKNMKHDVMIFYTVRTIQCLFILGFCYLYKNLLRNRKKFMSTPENKSE
jgi:very-long-chain (3R)-3-hydroxyacyl-CoA dehydratase